jgi:hypothetical protein
VKNNEILFQNLSNCVNQIAVTMETYGSFNENAGKFEAGAKRDKAIGGTIW